MNEPWKKLLKPYAKEFERLEARLERRLEKLSDKKLVELRTACGFPSMSNCGWATFRAAKHLSGMCYAENNRRNSKAKD